MQPKRPSVVAPDGREWPPDDGGFAADPSTYACWPCRKTARPDMAFRRRSKADRRSDPMDRGWPCCPSCGAEMADMGMKWRPGRKGKWKTGAEVDEAAKARAFRRAPARVAYRLVKPRWSHARKRAQAIEAPE